MPAWLPTSSCLQAYSEEYSLHMPLLPQPLASHTEGAEGEQFPDTGAPTGSNLWSSTALLTSVMLGAGGCTRC